MALKVFADESGKGTRPVFVMAGYIARAECWAAFNPEWRATLDDRPAIESFHMTDARWSGVDSKLSKLTKIIEQHVMAGLAVTVWHDDYEQAMRGKIAGSLDHPYFCMLLFFIHLATVWQIENGINEPMDFIFDEQRGDSDALQSVWSNVAEFMYPEMRERVPSRPIHADDKAVLPLQAADILAWCVRKNAELEREGRPADPHATAVIARVPFRRMHYGAERLRETVVRVNARNAQSGNITLHQAKAAMDNIDLLIQAYNKRQIEAASPGDVIRLSAFPATQMKRFQLVYMCPRCDTPHLHRRVGDVCRAGA